MFVCVIREMLNNRSGSQLKALKTSRPPPCASRRNSEVKSFDSSRRRAPIIARPFPVISDASNLQSIGVNQTNDSIPANYSFTSSSSISRSSASRALSGRARRTVRARLQNRLQALDDATRLRISSRSASKSRRRTDSPAITRFPDAALVAGALRGLRLCQERAGVRAVAWPVRRMLIGRRRSTGPSEPTRRLARLRHAASESLTFSYKVFANDLSGTFSQLDTRHANFNGGRSSSTSPGTSTTPSPQDRCAGRVEDHQRTVEGDGADRVQLPELRRAHGHADRDCARLQRRDLRGRGQDLPRRSPLVRRRGRPARRIWRKAVEHMVRAETAMMPEPDYEQYTFLFHFDPTARRSDGMEHLNSTQIIETGALADRGHFEGAVGTAAHEFFHVWNVKRLRPVGLGPWDFTRPVVTRGLWIAEGFTNYFGKLAQRRAGLWDDEQLLQVLRLRHRRHRERAGQQGDERRRGIVARALHRPRVERAAHEPHRDGRQLLPEGRDAGRRARPPHTRALEGARLARNVMRRAYEEFYLKSPKRQLLPARGAPTRSKSSSARLPNLGR